MVLVDWPLLRVESGCFSGRFYYNIALFELVTCGHGFIIEVETHNSIMNIIDRYFPKMIKRELCIITQLMFPVS